MANTKPRAPRKSANSSKDKRANGEGSIYWDQSKKRWIGAAYDINGKLRRKSCLKKSEAKTSAMIRRELVHLEQALSLLIPR